MGSTMDGTTEDIMGNIMESTMGIMGRNKCACGHKLVASGMNLWIILKILQVVMKLEGAR